MQTAVSSLTRNHADIGVSKLRNTKKFINLCRIQLHREGKIDRQRKGRETHTRARTDRQGKGHKRQGGGGERERERKTDTGMKEGRKG